MKSHSRFNLILVLLIAIFTVGCDKQSDTPRITTSTFNQHISAYKGGILQSGESVSVRFKPVKGLDEIDPNTLISFDPEIRGTAIWESSDQLRFAPDDEWRPGITYTATVRLSQVDNLPSGTSDFRFNFHIAPQTYEITDVRLVSSPDLKSQTLKGSIIFSNDVDKEKLESALTVTGGNDSYDIDWHYNLGDNRHNFEVATISRRSSEFNIEIEVDGSVFGVEKDFKHTLTIPELDAFVLTGLRTINDDDRYLEAEFSDRLDPDQEIEGLVITRPAVDVSVVIDGNQLRIYPGTGRSGDYEVQINRQLQNVNGKKLKEDIIRSIEWQADHPEIALLNEGVISPRSVGLKFPFKAINVRAVQLRIVQIFEENMPYFLQRNALDEADEIKRAGRLVYRDILHLHTSEDLDLHQWNQFSLDIEKYVDVQPGAIYRVYLSLDPGYSLYECDEGSELGSSSDFRVDWNRNINQSDSNYWNYYGYTPERDWDVFSYGDRENPCTPSYYMSQKATVSRNIIASELGLIVKSDTENKLRVAVTDITSAKSQSGVELSVYTFQNTLIGKGKTNSKGFATLELSGQPFLVVAQLGSDYNYLRVDDGSVESVSMFQAEGLRNKGGVKGFLYAERGVWRPGDSVYLQFILQDHRHNIPKGHPLIFEWYNPKSQLEHREVLEIGKNPIYDLRVTTDAEDPTGIWRAAVKLGNHTFDKSLRIESVKPNRLSTDIDLGDEPVNVTEGEISGAFQSEWLHGAPAANLNAVVELKLRTSNSTIDGYEGYRFSNAAMPYLQKDVRIFEGDLDKDGKATITKKLNLRNAPGMLTGQFTSRVYEEGGEFSIDRKVIELSPYDRYVGLKISEGTGWRGALMEDDDRVAGIVMTDKDGNPLEGRVKLQFYGLSWSWWYDHNRGSDLSNFMRSKSNQLVHTEEVEVSGGKMFYDIPDMEGYSSYILIASDLDGDHSSSHTFRLGWNIESENKESAKMLQFDVAKDVYQVEEEINVVIPSNGKGHFIVSLESADQVIEMRRVEAEEGQTNLRFTADAALVPNAYIYVAYIQPHAGTANDLPLRMFGIRPVTIEDRRSRLSPQLSMSDTWEPQSTVDVKVSEAQGKEMYYTLAVVDEGLLQLTRFQTPDPWQYFHQKEALAVRTWDIYDQVMGATSGELAALLAIGGDGTVIDREEADANRFPPVVRFLGPFHLSQNEKKIHEIDLPNYVGQVRVMLVAATDNAYGYKSGSVRVRKPLMLLASLPRVLGPGETTHMPVTVFAMEEGIQKVRIEASSNDLLELSETVKTVEFNQPGQKVVYFPIDVSRKTGIAKIELSASGNGHTAQTEIELNVRPSNPAVRESYDVVLEPGESKDVEVNLLGISGTNEWSIEATSGISIDMGEKADRLYAYPHGCIEQTTSRVFPQLYANEILEPGSSEQQSIKVNILAGIDRIYSFQLANGGVGYWPNARYASPWGTTYAGHFMLEAHALGYHVPENFMVKWRLYQKEVANNWLPRDYGQSVSGSQHGNELDQAYRLFTLALAEDAQIGAMNRLRAQPDLGIAARWRLALAYALIGRDDVAAGLVSGVNTDVPEYEHYGRTFGSRLRDQAMILEGLVAMDRASEAHDLAQFIATRWENSSWYSTQTSAYVLLSLFKYIEYQPTSDMNWTYSLDGGSRSVVTQSGNLFYSELADPEPGIHVVNLTNNGDQRVFVSVNTEGVPVESNEVKSAKNLNINVTYRDLNGEEINPQLLYRGTDFIASVTVTNPGRLGDYSEMALTRIIPSGWEIHNSRLDLITDQGSLPRPEYQDIRDDRVLTYFDLPAGQSRTWSVRMTATYPGQYYLPGIYCEAMYDGDIYALEPGQWVEVSTATAGMVYNQGSTSQTEGE